MSVDAMISPQSLTPLRWHFISHARLRGWFSFGNFRTTDVSPLGERNPELWTLGRLGSAEERSWGVGNGTHPGPSLSWFSKAIFSDPDLPYEVSS